MVAGERGGYGMRTVTLLALSATTVLAAPASEGTQPAPRREWAAACRASLGRDDANACFNVMRRMVSERYPAATVGWERCRDRNAAERWGWAALMQERDARAFLEAVKGACGE